MIDQHQQGGGSPLLQLILQGTEIEVVFLAQLLAVEQVGDDQDINGSPYAKAPGGTGSQ